MMIRGVVLEDLMLEGESREVHVLEGYCDGVCYRKGSCYEGDDAKIVANR